MGWAYLVVLAAGNGPEEDLVTWHRVAMTVSRSSLVTHKIAERCRAMVTVAVGLCEQCGCNNEQTEGDTQHTHLQRQGAEHSMFVASEVINTQEQESAVCIRA
jgi:hypothetical protein